MRFIDTEGHERCGEPEDPDVDGTESTFDHSFVISLALLTVQYLVGLAIASKTNIRIKLLSGSSAIDAGKWTGETVEAKQVRSEQQP